MKKTLFTALVAALSTQAGIVNASECVPVNGEWQCAAIAQEKAAAIRDSLLSQGTGESCVEIRQAEIVGEVTRNTFGIVNGVFSGSFETLCTLSGTIPVFRCDLSVTPTPIQVQGLSCEGTTQDGQAVRANLGSFVANEFTTLIPPVFDEKEFLSFFSVSDAVSGAPLTPVNSSQTIAAVKDPALSSMRKTHNIDLQNPDPTVILDSISIDLTITDSLAK